MITEKQIFHWSCDPENLTPPDPPHTHTHTMLLYISSPQDVPDAEKTFSAHLLRWHKGSNKVPEKRRFSDASKSGIKRRGKKVLVLHPFSFSLATSSNQQFNASSQTEDVFSRRDYINMSPRHTSADTYVLNWVSQTCLYVPARGQAGTDAQTGFCLSRAVQLDFPVISGSLSSLRWCRPLQNRRCDARGRAVKR